MSDASQQAWEAWGLDLVERANGLFWEMHGHCLQVTRGEDIIDVLADAEAVAVRINALDRERVLWHDQYGHLGSDATVGGRFLTYNTAAFAMRQLARVMWASASFVETARTFPPALESAVGLCAETEDMAHLCRDSVLIVSTRGDSAPESASTFIDEVEELLNREPVQILLRLVSAQDEMPECWRVEPEGCGCGDDDCPALTA